MTIKEIALLAGTSRGTVDRVLNGRGKVNPELAARILEIAEREKYRPNQLAQALINSRKALRVGIVIHSVDNPFFNDVLKGIYDRGKKLYSFGLRLSVQQIKGYDPDEQLKALEKLQQEGVNGLAIMPIDCPEIKKALETLEIPIVTFNSDIDIERLAFVGCDYYNSGMMSGDLARVMLHHGGTAAVVVGNLMVRGHSERFCGFTDSLRECSNITVLGPLENQDDDAISYKIVSQLLREKQVDLLYFGAGGLKGGIQAVKESGQNIQILAVDETDLVRQYLRDGTIAATVTQQPYLQGDLSVRLLYEYLSTQKRPKQVVCFTSNEIKLRHSI